MSKFLFLLFFIFISNISICQTAYPYQDIKLEKPADYKATESLALSAASYLLSNPFKTADINRTRALNFLTTWVTGAKGFEYNLKGKIEEISSDRVVLGLFIAAVVKYSLENKNESANPKHVEMSAGKLVLAYCDNPVNNFKLKKKIRKVLESN